MLLLFSACTKDPAVPITLSVTEMPILDDDEYYLALDNEQKALLARLEAAMRDRDYLAAMEVLLSSDFLQIADGITRYGKAYGNVHMSSWR
jgi:hypothetical protein